MKNKIVMIVLLILSLCLPIACTNDIHISGDSNVAYTADAICSAEQVFGQISDMIRKTSASVVKVTVEFSVLEEDKKQNYEASGTGFFVSANNKTYILVFSAGHLVRSGGRYQAYREDLNTGKKTTFPLTLAAFDKDLDFSVFSFNPKKLYFRSQPLLLADSFIPAQKVFAIGAPGGLYLNYTEGYTASKIFTFDSKDDSDFKGDYILHSAAVSLGNSGGPLVNLKGEVVGINLAYFMPSEGYQQMSLAKPSYLIKKFLSKILKK